jgi:hypothetical protein
LGRGPAAQARPDLVLVAVPDIIAGFDCDPVQGPFCLA